MPPAINTFHILITLIAFGILVGAGWALAHAAIVWPGSQWTWAAGVICILILIIAWLV